MLCILTVVLVGKVRRYGDKLCYNCDEPHPLHGVGMQYYVGCNCASHAKELRPCKHFMGALAEGIMRWEEVPEEYFTSSTMSLYGGPEPITAPKKRAQACVEAAALQGRTKVIKPA